MNEQLQSLKNTKTIIVRAAVSKQDQYSKTASENTDKV